MPAARITSGGRLKKFTFIYLAGYLLPARGVEWGRRLGVASRRSNRLRTLPRGCALRRSEVRFGVWDCGLFPVAFVFPVLFCAESEVVLGVLRAVDIDGAGGEHLHGVDFHACAAGLDIGLFHERIRSFGVNRCWVYFTMNFLPFWM